MARSDERNSKRDDRSEPSRRKSADDDPPHRRKASGGSSATPWILIVGGVLVFAPVDSFPERANCGAAVHRTVHESNACKSQAVRQARQSDLDLYGQAVMPNVA